MTLLFDKYKITSYNYGWKISKKKGLQWNVISYHSTLKNALSELFDLRVKVDTKDFIVDFEDAVNFDTQKNALVYKIIDIKNDMLDKIRSNK